MIPRNKWVFPPAEPHVSASLVRATPRPLCVTLGPPYLQPTHPERFKISHDHPRLSKLLITSGNPGQSGGNDSKRPSPYPLGHPLPSRPRALSDSNGTNGASPGLIKTFMSRRRKETDHATTKQSVQPTERLVSCRIKYQDVGCCSVKWAGASL